MTTSWPSADAFTEGAINPLQLWMKMADMWQKSLADTMTFWSKTTKLH
jgi:hypothetical protein